MRFFEFLREANIFAEGYMLMRGILTVMVLSTGKEQISVSLKDLESVITNDISIEPDEKEGKITVRLIKREPPTPVIDIKEGKKEAKKK